MHYLAASSEDDEGFWADAYPIIPHPGELIFGLVAFLILLWIITKKVVPAFEKAYAERASAIEGGIARAEQAQAEADQAKQQYTAALAEARGEAAKIRAEAQSERKAIVDGARAEAEEAAARVHERSTAALDAEITNARGELSREVGRLAVDLASRIVGENLAETEATRRTVDRFISDLEERAPVAEGQG